jgi:D-alanyl-D-alanine dipeptidase
MSNDMEQRRAYWARMMDDARAFVLAIQEVPIKECGETFADLRQAAKDAGVEVTFSQSLNGGVYPRIFMLRTGLIPSYLGAAREMNKRGWVMKVEDGYRSREMQRGLARTPALFRAVLERTRWELGGKTPSAAFLAKRLSALIAPNARVGTHMSCSAIDISVFDRATGQEIDRGAPYLEMSELTPMESPFVSAQARANRLAIRDIMVANGFVAYAWEFWHYNAGDTHEVHTNRLSIPARYGPVDWDPATNRVTPVANPLTPLNSDAELQEQIENVLRPR